MTEQMNVPKLRFGEFTTGNIDTTLEALTKKKISYGIVQAGPHIPDGMPYIKSTNLNTELCLDNLERTSDEIAKSYQRSEVSPEDIVFSLRGNIGLTRIVPASIPVANLTQGTARLSIKDSFSNVYVNYCLSTRKVYKRVNSVSKGSTFKEISLADLRNVKITHSSDLKEQQKIASFLSKVDEKIGLLSDKKDKLIEYKCGVMQQLFNGKWHEQDGQLTFVPPTLRFKADDGSEFPDWEAARLREHAVFKGGSGFKETYQGKTFGDLPFIKVSDMNNVGNEKFIVNSNNYISTQEAQALKVNIFDSGAIVFAKVGAALLLNRRRILSQDTIIDNNMMAAVVKPNTNNLFLYQYLLTVDFGKFVQEGAVPSINQGDMNAIQVTFPCLKEQNKIANFLSAIDKKIDLANSELDKAKEWKKGLLQQMFV
ncbi:restriction endonuclease subunit S [Aliivibrio fischeri]|uniref:restriction endonuclease subunit S n=1 Tax=Aliivibrio fischeri TaxID=668 RepID=UPI001F3D5ECF|nr:restriction endonuclease subunit S [Aliivibrio fischeri]MCE7567900.1 restriction endonuclease subunit S [Aliivibrio fischeri]